MYRKWIILPLPLIVLYRGNIYSMENESREVGLNIALRKLGLFNM